MKRSTIPAVLNRVERLDITGHDGSVFMRRFRLLRTPWGNLYVHQFLRGDEDKCLHDHPWRFVTLILAGGYTEIMPGGMRWRPPGTFLFRPAKHRHRVDCDRPSWSLVFVGKKERAWGFWTRFGWQPWRPDQPRPICEFAASPTPDAPPPAGQADPADSGKIGAGK